MAQFITTTIGNGQAVIDGAMLLKSVLLTPAAATATAKIYANGVEMIRLQASASGSSVSYFGGGQASNDFAAEHIIGPVTVDLAGAGAFLKITY